MPWVIKKSGDKYCVYKEGADGEPKGESLKCHDSREEALAHMRALYANVDEEKSVDLDELKAETRKKEGEHTYPASAYLVHEGGPSEWHLRVYDENGKLDTRLLGAAHAALLSPGGHRGQPYSGPGKEGAIAKLKRLYKEAGLDWPEGKSLKFGMYEDGSPYVPMGIVTVADAMAAQEAQHEVVEINGLLSMFQQVVSNICYSSEISNKSKAIKGAAEELSGLLDIGGNGKNRLGLAHGKSAPSVVPQYILDYIPIVKSLGNDRVGSHAVLWGDENRKDLTEEYFDKNTEELTAIFDAVGRLPYLYHHATDGTLKTAVIGVVDTLKIDSVGLWYEAQLKLADEYAEYVKKLLEGKKLKTSTQTFPVTRRVNQKTGRIERWPIVEITATPAPAEYRMQPIEFLKSAYQMVGCEDFACLIKTKFGIEAESGGGQGAEKARLLMELEQARLVLDYF